MFIIIIIYYYYYYYYYYHHHHHHRYLLTYLLTYLNYLLRVWYLGESISDEQFAVGSDGDAVRPDLSLGDHRTHVTGDVDEQQTVTGRIGDDERIGTDERHVARVLKRAITGH